MDRPAPDVQKTSGRDRQGLISGAESQFAVEDEETPVLARLDERLRAGPWRDAAHAQGVLSVRLRREGLVDDHAALPAKVVSLLRCQEDDRSLLVHLASPREPNSCDTSPKRQRGLKPALAGASGWYVPRLRFGFICGTAIHPTRLLRGRFFRQAGVEAPRPRAVGDDEQ